MWCYKEIKGKLEYGYKRRSGREVNVEERKWGRIIESLTKSHVETYYYSSFLNAYIYKGNLNGVTI